MRGISTRRVEGLVEAAGVTSLSKSQVSELARDLDQTVAEFRNRPLDAGPYTHVWADALVVKAREGGRVVNVALLSAVGVNNEGHRVLIPPCEPLGLGLRCVSAFFRPLNRLRTLVVTLAKVQVLIPGLFADSNPISV